MHLVCSIVGLYPNTGHEDLDQAFSQQAALICRRTFDTPEQVAEILDTNCRPDDAGERARKRNKTHKVEAAAAKLDETANWREWGSVVGVYVKGVRILAIAMIRPQEMQLLYFLPSVKKVNGK